MQPQQSTSSQLRYRWSRLTDTPERVVLVDSITSLQIASIVPLGRNWQWQRKTSTLLHGAPPAAGTATSLTQAKIAVLQGLPNEK